MKNTHILLTNDDGIHAEGIQRMGQALSECNEKYKLTVIAPERERSAIGHAITMHKPLRVAEVRFLHKPAIKGWSVNGTPSDCVKLAVEAMLEDKPDMVISGINRGSNLGTDVLYSGTVSAAVEGLLLGIPSVAVSLTGNGDSRSFEYAARLVTNMVPQLFKGGLEASTLININIPVNIDEIKGVRVTKLGTRRYQNAFEKRTDPRGSHYYWLAGELIKDDPEDNDNNNDTKAVQENYISITPIHFRLTDWDAMPSLEKLIKGMNLF